MKTIELNAIEFGNAHEAIQWACASGHGEAALIGGKPYVVEQDEAERLAEAGVEFAYAFDHDMPDGTQRVVTVPVN